MVFWTIWKKFYPTHLTFLGWLNYKLCQKMPKLEKNPCWPALCIVMGSSSNFFGPSIKNWKNAKIWVFSISVTYSGCLQMVLDFGPFFLSKKIHFLDKIEKKSKLGDFLEIRKISCIWSLLVMTFFSFVLKLMSYGRLILRRVKLTNFENVYHGPVVLWRLYLLNKTILVHNIIIWQIISTLSDYVIPEWSLIFIPIFSSNLLCKYTIEELEMRHCA